MHPLGPEVFGSTEDWPANWVPDVEVDRRLATVPVGELIDFVLDGNREWHHRRRCARALFGRVPADRTMALLDVVRSDGHQADVRIAVLEVLTATPGPHTEDLLAWHRVLGAESPSALMTSGATEAARLIGVGLAHDTGADIQPALADPAVIVARASYDLLIQQRGPAFRREPLLVTATTPGPAQLWALAVLADHHPTHARPLWEQLGPPLIEAALTEFLHIQDELAETVFDGLVVYYFGDRKPLRVRELLFYWQD